MKRYGLFVSIILCGLSLVSGCDEDKKQNEGDGAQAGTDSTVLPDSAVSEDAAIADVALPDSDMSPDVATADGSSGVDTEAGIADATGDGPAATKVSKPGEYNGYSEAIYSDEYELTSQYVTVSDGTRLALDLYRPKDKTTGEVITDKLPVLWMHTPYNRRNFDYGGNTILTGIGYPGSAATLVKYGYVVAIVDFRGLYASFGHNVAYNRGEWISAAQKDAYDITEWLAIQPWSNGKIGMWGCSATGGSQLQAATTAPPSLKAIFPMSCEFDAYPFGVPGGMAPPAGTPTSVPPGEQTTQASRDAVAQPVDADTDKTLLNQAIAQHAGTIENAGYVPFRDSLSDTVTDEAVKQWWIKSSPHTYLEAIKTSGIAIYAAANWDEAATKYGAFFTYNNVTNPVKLIVGPGTHCAWFTVQRETGFDITIEERRFFDYWLKGIENGVMTEDPIYYYTYNAPSGSEWRSAKQWPLPNETRTKYYLALGALSASAPTEADQKDETTVAYDVTADNMTTKGLVYVTEPLTADLEITGHPTIDLWVSSSATDGDFVATLQDVAPDGTAVSYNVHGRLRASLRKLEEAPYNNLGLPWHRFYEADVTPLVPGEPTQLAFDLLPISMIIKSGHSIRLVINFAATATPVLTPAPTVAIYRDATHASSITLPVINN
ncbi:MAG: CocE/NonD family hydrolase [Deltaproteobacteria bacterium]|nr:CocE/NonD family hydrolase [Deltaproteobacteria bacterium]